LLNQVYATECLPNSLKNQVVNQNRYNIATSKGATYQEARMKLNIEIPKVGFLQQVKQEEEAILTDKGFNRKVIQYKKLKANVDIFKEYACKKNGEFYVTAIWAKEGVSYIDFKLPKKLTIRNIKKWCGNKKIVIFADKGGAYNTTAEKEIKIYTFRSERLNLHTNTWYVMCGRSRFQFGEKKHAGRSYPILNTNNNFDQFLFFNVNRYSVENLSLDMWLHLTKNL